MRTTPTTTKHQQGYTFAKQATQIRMARLLELLKTPHTRAELSEALACSIRTTQVYLAALLGEKRIHIADWRRNSPGEPSPIYLLGNEPHKHRPRKFTQAQRIDRYRQNHPEVEFNATMRKRLARAVPRRDPLVAAFFGGAA